MDPIVMAAGTALIGAMATDGWQRVMTRVIALWRRSRPQQADTIETDLHGLHDQVLEARHSGDEGTEEALAGAWRLRLQQLVRDDPATAAALRQLLDETLAPMLAPAERDRVATIAMTGTSHDSSTFNQFAGDQINYHP